MRLLRSIRRSLPARLLLVFLATGTLIVCLASAIWGTVARYHFKQNIRPHITQYVDYVTQDLGQPPSRTRARELSREVPVNINIVSGDEVFSSIDRPIDLDEIDLDDDRSSWRREVTSPSGYNFRVGDSDDAMIIHTRVGEHDIYYEVRHDNFRRTGPRSRDNSGRNKHPKGPPGILLASLAILLAALALCYWLIRRMLKPVWDIQSSVQRMGAGELDHRIEITRDDDLGDLAGSINTMASDIQRMLDAKRELLLGISHELRSPITRAKISAELLDSSVTKDRIVDDLREMESLVTELLESERLNSPHSVLNPVDVWPGALVRTVVQESFQDTVELQSGNDEKMQLDETRVRLLLRNIIANAVRHGANADAMPVVSSECANGTFVVTVTDQGPGIAPEHIENLTDPFYRVDPSRTRSTGGFGLGLYLCRLICEAHGGEVRITSAPDAGTTITATLKSVPHRT